MLFSIKKQIASVLALGVLMSTGSALAWSPNTAQVSLAAGALVAYLHQRTIDVTVKEKNVVTKALDSGTHLVHKVEKCDAVRTGLVAAAVAAVVYNHAKIQDALISYVEALKGAGKQ